MSTPVAAPQTDRFFLMEMAALLAIAGAGALFGPLRKAPVPAAPPPEVVAITSPVQFAEPPPPPPAQPYPVTPPPPTTGIEPCDAYFALIEELGRCEKIPQESRSGMREAVAQARQAFARMRDQPEAARKAASDACAQANDAVRQVMQQLDCPAQK
jgi:uncharacterized membrane protein